jgi:hypothetical protein
MKIYKVLAILFLWPMGQAMGAAAAATATATATEEEDPWVKKMVTRYGGDATIRAALEDMKPSECNWLEEKASRHVTEQHAGRWKSLVDLMEAPKGTPQGPKWFDQMVDKLSVGQKYCSEANIEALLTIPSNVRLWVSDMTGHLMTLDFEGDLENWVSLLKHISASYVERYGVQSRQRVGWRLEKIFQKFRNFSMKSELPKDLNMKFFQETIEKYDQSGSASASEVESEVDE